jgi:putative redox protein
MARNVQVNAGQARFLQNISVGPHSLQGDESVDVGGSDAGASPHEMLLAALGTCASITVRMYAERKQWPLEGVRIELSYAQTHSFATGSGDVRNADEIEMDISFWGDLSDEQRERLLQVAGKCPVHRILTSSIPIRAKLAL